MNNISGWVGVVYTKQSGETGERMVGVYSELNALASSLAHYNAIPHTIARVEYQYVNKMPIKLEGVAI